MHTCSDALTESQEALAGQQPAGARGRQSVKHGARLRLQSLPLLLDARQQPWLHPAIGGVRSCHVGRLLSLPGKVVRAGPVQTLEARRTYECTRCSFRWGWVSILPSQGAACALIDFTPLHGGMCLISPASRGLMCHDWKALLRSSVVFAPSPSLHA